MVKMMERLKGNNITIETSPLRIVGSKRRLIQLHGLMDYFPECKNKTFYLDGVKKNHRRYYVELFAGGAIMFFNLDPTPNFAILNDINHDIFNFWNVIATRYEEFRKEIEFTWCGQDWINKYEGKQDDVSKAILFYLRNRMENIVKIPIEFPKEIKFDDWKAKMDKCRLHVWNDDYKIAFEKLNKMAFQENDNCMQFLMFEDPPYYKTESFYEGFKEQDHEILARFNHETTHHVILTYNDCPKIRELYADWYVLELKNYTTMKWRYNTELLLSNRPLVNRGEKNESRNARLF